MISESEIVVLADQPDEEIRRSVNLTNEQWSILAMCVDSYADTFRTKQSQIVTTYVTRNQLENAVQAAEKMNTLLQQLDTLQAKLL